VVGELRKQTQDGFDVLLPNPGPDPTPSAPIDPTTGQPPPGPEPVGWSDEIIRFSLKNVTVCEIFNAMNLQFQLNKRPLRWDLALNGTRPIEVLRVLDRPEPGLTPVAAREERIRTVIYVGDMLEKHSPAGMTLEGLRATLLKVDSTTGGGQLPLVLSTFEPGDLLVVQGTADRQVVEAFYFEALNFPARPFAEFA
jgi:hypothetical protein